MLLQKCVKCDPIVAREGHLDMTLSISLGSEVTQASEFFNRKI